LPQGGVQVLGTPAEGVAEFRALLGRAQIRRWPMYLRNVKQVFRQASPVFDERAYGFANLVDLLRAAQKEGLVRMDRDRQGVVRVFQGTAAPAAPIVTVEPQPPAVVEAPAAIVDDLPEPEATAETDLSVGPGNVEQPPMPVAEPGRRRVRAVHTRTRVASPRRPRKSR
jgi:hypothetical protein